MRKKLPIIVGGTSLYIKMFLEGCSGAPPSTPEGQARVDEVIKGKPWDERSVQFFITSLFNSEYFSSPSLSWKLTAFG